MTDKEKIEKALEKWYSSSVIDLGDGTFEIDYSTERRPLSGRGGSKIVKVEGDEIITVKSLGAWMS